MNRRRQVDLRIPGTNATEDTTNWATVELENGDLTARYSSILFTGWKVMLVIDCFRKEPHGACIPIYWYAKAQAKLFVPTTLNPNENLWKYVLAFHQVDDKQATTGTHKFEVQSGLPACSMHGLPACSMHSAAAQCCLAHEGSPRAAKYARAVAHSGGFGVSA